MRLHPELEAYRDRLMERAAAWPDTPEADLTRDLQQCEAQIALLEKGITALRRKLTEAGMAVPHPDAAPSPVLGPNGGPPGSNPSPGTEPPVDARTPSEALAHRASIQDQMRELTVAYAEVLRRHLQTRTS